MRILIAEDDLVSRRLLQAKLTKWGYEVIETCDGAEAWQALRQENAPRLAILDWMMPGIDGIDVCRKVRQISKLQTMYIILLTTKGEKNDIVEGLQAGADDYVTKPFESGELQARVQVGLRVLQLQLELANQVKALEEAFSQVKQLRGLLPICSYCKKIRDDQNYWQQVEEYITIRSDVEFSHGICPNCYETIVKPELEEFQNLSKQGK